MAVQDRVQRQRATPPSHGTEERRQVLILAAEPIYQLGLRAALGDSFSIVASVETVSAAQRVLSERRPSLAVVLLDPPPPDASLEAASSCLLQAYPAVGFLVLLQHPDADRVRMVCRHGARGVFDVGVAPPSLRDALLRIAAGDVAVQASLLPHLARWDGRAETAPVRPDRLTQREFVTLRLLAQGYCAKEIAARLGVSRKAVYHAMDRVVRRLGAAHRTHAVALAQQRGLLG
jgi:DNA-binding NarL/FixJ family response regulator